MLVAMVQDLHSLQGDVEPVVVNRIPLKFTDWMEANLLTADLKDERSWRGRHSTVSRLDGDGYNDATDNQKSKVWRFCREAVTGLFADPEFIFEVILADQRRVIEQRRAEFQKAQAAADEADARLASETRRLFELRDAKNLDSRQRVFGLTP